ncbi:MAG: bifunctional 5,10-methylenetetrahydrofolate dehydrogenase/5,10-methenyltetrahydrofolate cyclohydrolase [Candidatus Midichloria sp.]|uniref:C-1-tetrahydrofolate synthase, cytoplasmic n=1 Tax=Hyalomma marginatum TaxID=34627 RepID=A0A8S4C2X7_9ACAR|nr:bifunctional methylenetetrahydrofolate dehydrogenase/methenyltetrahydrofolate cyclohydrolase [Hyalomma marginatum]CAG7597825.1 bifunctional methylenetetrahydrofolate dehydrogenase/methenyltetrahydrofolate cyclohydrolase [Hyalomma marginatum]
MQNCEIIDGKLYSAKVLERVKSKIEHLSTVICKTQRSALGFAVISVGTDTASQIYVNNKVKKAKEVGLNSEVYKFPQTATEQEIIECIEKLNSDPNVNGILVQLPLPQHINTQKIIDTVNYEKDVDGFSTYNVGLLNSWQDSLEPCTPQGVLILLHEVLGTNISGKKAVILGRSRIVGRPMASILIRESCSVTSLNSNSYNIKDECRTADILISAVGSPSFIKGDWIKKGACVIDVGIVKVNDKLYGDVDFESVRKVAGFLTPVPGGVGPMTVSCLMLNTIKAAYKQYDIKW